MNTTTFICELCGATIRLAEVEQHNKLHDHWIYRKLYPTPKK